MKVGREPKLQKGQHARLSTLAYAALPPLQMKRRVDSRATGKMKATATLLRFLELLRPAQDQAEASMYSKQYQNKTVQGVLCK